MDQKRIGKFIQEKRKEKMLTQNELAEKLNITDRAISKWENGICLPDASIMHDLCSILNITINDLFSGKVVGMNDNEKKLEENLLEMVRVKEEKDRQLLKLEIDIGCIVSVTFITLIFVASFIDMDSWCRILLIVIGSVMFAWGISNAIKIEQVAGYYECSNCKHKYIPTYQSVFWAMHIGRRRKMRCQKCNKKVWHNKVLTK